MIVRRVAFVSFRFGGRDGVSVEAAKWAAALRTLGAEVRFVAGTDPADVVLPELAIGASGAPPAVELREALAGTDLVVVENLCSLPLQPDAAVAVAEVLRGRPAVLRHHDLGFQRPRFADAPPPPDDPAWRHVVINDLSRRQLAARGLEAAVLRNRFPVEGWHGDRGGTRAALGVAGRLLLQPTRAIARKQVPIALALAEALDATFWLLGPTEDGYDDELASVLGGASVPVRRGDLGRPVADAYAASDAVAFPSAWEGFGNPVVESALARRPLAIERYPVAQELQALAGFEWFPARDAAQLRAFLDEPDDALLDRNRDRAVAHFDLRALPGELRRLIAEAGWRLP